MQAPRQLPTSLLATLTLLAGLLAGCVGGAEPVPTPLDGAAIDAIRTTEFCVLTTDRVFGLPLVLRGTRFHSGDLDPSVTAVVLAHGVASTRAYLDGIWLGDRLTDNRTLARTLAAAGLNVFTYDRPGYGESPWDDGPRDGRSLGTQAQLDAMADVVAAVRDGTYRTMTDDDCGAGTPAGTGAARILLGGHSLGGLLTRLYLGMVGDVDGAIVLHWSAVMTSNVLVEAFATCSARDPLATYFHVFCETDYSEAVLRPEADADQVATMIDYAAIPKDPRGLDDVAPYVLGLHAQITATPAIPVLLVNGAQDYAFVEPDGSGGHMAEDAWAWDNLCACDATYWIQPGAGHIPLLFETRHPMHDGILKWIANNEFGALPPGEVAEPSRDLAPEGCAAGAVANNPSRLHQSCATSIRLAPSKW